MTKPARIPLFPLDVVLFPGMSLPLHIFEPRYRVMTRRCLDEHLEFGVVLAQQEGIAPVGCTAAISRVVREYPDGKMDILTAGHSVFQILEVIEEQPYFEARVEYRPEDAEASPVEVQREILRLFRECQALLSDATSPPDPDSPVPLSYQILGVLPFALEYKQQMLEIPSESERCRKLLGQMREWVPQISHMQRVQGKAGGNGHGLS